MIVLVFVGNDTEIYHTHIWQSLPHYALQYTASIHELFISELMTIITLYTATSNWNGPEIPTLRQIRLSPYNIVFVE